MPRRSINNEGDVARLLADAMMKLMRARGDKLTGNDLHALVGASETYTYMKEVSRVVQGRERIVHATGLDPVQIDIQRHAIMRRLKQGIEQQTGERIELPAPPKRKPTAKPQVFSTAEKNIARNAKIKTGLPERKGKKKRVKLRPSPRTVGR